MADTLSKAVYNLWYERYDRMLNGLYVPEYRLLLGIHDAVMLECRPKDLRIMMDEVIPKCMCDMCVVPGINLRFNAEIEACYRWGEKLSKEDIAKICNGDV